MRCAISDRSFQHVRRGEIDRNAKKIGELVLQPHHIQQGQVLRRIKFGNQIDIRSPGLGTCHRTMQTQMKDAGSLQLRLVLA
jgi:hypothetical protein